MSQRSDSPFRDAWRRLRRHRVAVVSIWVLLAIVVIAVAGPFLSPYPFDRQDLPHQLQAPSLGHPFGTDAVGRDLMTRVMRGDGLASRWASSPLL